MRSKKGDSGKEIIFALNKKVHITLFQFTIMEEYLFMILIGLLTIASTVVSSKGGLYDKRCKWNKVITKRGWSVVILLLFAIGLTIRQTVSSKKAEQKKELILLEQNRIRDSAYDSNLKESVEENRKKLFSDLSEALASQSLRLDTVTKSLEKLEDPRKQVIVKTPFSEPTIMMGEDAITYTKLGNDSLRFSYKLTSKDEKSKNLNISAYIEIVETNGSIITEGPFNIFEQKEITTNAYLNEFFTVPKKIEEINFIHFAIWGTYTGIENSKIYRIKEVYLYNPLANSTKYLKSDFKEKYFVRKNLNQFIK